MGFIEQHLQSGESEDQVCYEEDYSRYDIYDNLDAVFPLLEGQLFHEEARLKIYEEVKVGEIGLAFVLRKCNTFFKTHLYVSIQIC